MYSVCFIDDSSFLQFLLELPFVLFITIGLWLKIMFLALNFVFTKKQRFGKHINWRNKQINVKNRTHYFYNDIINLKDFDAKLLKIDKKAYKSIDIYYNEYITIKKIDNYESIYSVNPFFCVLIM